MRYRDQRETQHSRSFSAHKDARALKLEVECRRQAGSLYVASPSQFADVAAKWLERFEHGAAGRVRPRAKTVALTRESLRCLAPVSSLTIDQIRRPLVEDLVSQLAARAPRRAEMTVALLKRILRSAEERGEPVDVAVYPVRGGRRRFFAACSAAFCWRAAVLSSGVGFLMNFCAAARPARAAVKPAAARPPT